MIKPDRIKGMLQDNLLKRIVSNSGIILFGNTTAAAFNFISLAIMAKQLGPEVLAIFVLAQTYALIVNDLFNVQTWESIIKFGAVKQEKESAVNVIKTNFILDLVSALLAFVCALVFLRPAMSMLGWDESYSLVFVLCVFSILFNLTSFTIGIPRLFDKFTAVARVNIATAFIKLASIVAAMFFSNSLLTYVYINLCYDVVRNLSLILYSMVLLKDNYGADWWRSRFSIDKTQIKFIWWTNLRTVVSIPIYHLDMIIISAVVSMKMVGIYKVYKEIASIIHRLAEPVNQSIFPEFARLIGSDNIEKTTSITKKAMLLLSGIGVIIIVVLLISSEFLVGTFIGQEYLADINALYLLMVLFVISFVTVPINSLFIAAGFAKYSFLILLITNIIYLATGYGCGVLLGIYGLIIAYAVQLFLNKGLKVYYLKKHSSGWGLVLR